MPMKNPPHPGRIVKRSLESLGITIGAAADQLGVSRKHLSDVLNGKAGISPAMAIRLESAAVSRLPQVEELPSWPGWLPGRPHIVPSGFAGGEADGPQALVTEERVPGLRRTLN